ncbi:MAG: hypothetical protein N2645_22375 [Clostridia bacterium]|nr:hypothetical protein [Clostridia bacterium]
MEFFILCAIVWLAVFIFIPLERIKELSIAAVIAFIWMVFVDNISANLGYYSYQHTALSIGRAPVFQNLAEGGLGILMINWLKENSLTKLLAVFIMGIMFVFVQNIYIQRGVFSFGSFDMILNFIHHIAALSIFVWLSLAVVGERKVYSGNKSRVWSRRIA